jgi:hypothetical protein
VTIAAAKQKRAVEQNGENARLQLREDWEVRDGFGDVHCDPTALKRWARWRQAIDGGILGLERLGCWNQVWLGFCFSISGLELGFGVWVSAGMCCASWALQNIPIDGIFSAVLRHRGCGRRVQMEEWDEGRKKSLERRDGGIYINNINNDGSSSKQWRRRLRRRDNPLRIPIPWIFLWNPVPQFGFCIDSVIFRTDKQLF